MSPMVCQLSWRRHKIEMMSANHSGVAFGIGFQNRWKGAPDAVA